MIYSKAVVFNLSDAVTLYYSFLCGGESNLKLNLLLHHKCNYAMLKIVMCFLIVIGNPLKMLLDS